MDILYSQIKTAIGSTYYEKLVQIPISERLTFDYTWQLVLTNLNSIYNIIESGNFKETIDILLSNLNDFKQLYSHIDAFTEALAFVVFISIVHYLLTLISNNYSQVDKAWSILPAVYSWHFFYHDYLNRGIIHPRLLIASILITVWGFRLTWNFARKGGYEWSGQDYRYPYIKKKIGSIAMGLLNVTIICPFQDVLLLFIVAPLYVTNLTYLSPIEVEQSLNRMDGLAILLFLFFFSIESIADEQQYQFQTEKYALLAYLEKKQLKGDYQRGFLTQGLFKYTRHPNFFAEMGMWWSIYIFSIGSTVGLSHSLHQSIDWTDPFNYLNWTIVGPFTLTMLFQGSTWITEHISSEKYIDYITYCKSVSRFIPWFSNNNIFNETHQKKD